ncbi:MAG: hypothetical protein ACI8P3_004459 [Saprospiraceae bacterium]|jgi:hypothetical protein
MKKQILLSAIFCLFLGFHTAAQCPIGLDATIVNSENMGGGQCRFRLEVSYSASSVTNTSISFTVGIAGGVDLYTTACIGDLNENNSPYSSGISNELLIAPCNSVITVSYTAYLDDSCDDAPCATNVNMPVNGSLPVDLVSFVGHGQKFDKVKLEWVTASEDQNAYFLVERSADGRSFEEIGLVEGNGNSSATEYYFFMDENSLRGENYYRLKQTNLDNTYEYSQVILVENKIDKSTALTLAPSVIINEITLIFNELPKANKFIEVFNMNGTNIIKTTLAEGEYTLDLDLSDYAPGMYFIRVPIGKEFVIKRFVKVTD